jgi:hypothetical protein
MREQGTRRIDFAWLAAIALAAVLLRLVALASYESAHPLAGTPVIDEASYDQWARRIAAGDWLGGREVWFQEPLYPYALAVIYKFLGDTLHAARVVQCVLWGLAAFLVGATTRRLFGRAACFVAAGMVALHGAGMVFPALLLKENLFLPLCAATAWLLVASRSAQGARAAGAWWLLGACVGAGALLRGNMLVLAPAFALWPVGRALVERRRGWTPWAHAALVVLGVASFLGPVLWRNHAVGGVAVLTTSGAGTNLYGGNNAENPWGRATEFSFIRGIPEHEAGDWRREAERRTGRALDPKETSDYWMGEVLRSARRDPLLHARILWNKLRLTLGAYEVPDNHMIDWDARFVPLARVLPSWGIFGLLGLAGALCFAMLALARRPPTLAVRCRGGAVELLLFLLLYLGTIVLTVTSDRSRLPLLALVAPFGGWIAAAAWALARERRWRALSMPILASCGAALFVHLPSLPAGERAKDMDEREYNLCVVLRDRGGEEEARQRALALAERHPRSARVRLLLHELDFRAAARRKDATRLAELARLGEALCAGDVLVPRERFRACALAAWCRLELGEGAAALAAFASARQFDGDALDLCLNSARALLLLAESEPARRAERAQEAELLLRGAAADHEGRLLLAQTAFERARSLERGSPVALQATREALARLEPLALSDSAPRSVRAEARRLAGWIQLWLGNAKSAANHFRAALDLGDAGTAELGLVSALLARAEAGEQDDTLLAEVDGRLQAMPVPGGPALEELRARRERLGGARR